LNYIINNNNILYYKRPIFRIKSQPYSATWLTVSKSDGEGRERDALVVFSGDFRERYSDIQLEGHSSLSEAPFKLDLQGKPRPAAALSAEAYIDHVIEQQPFPTPAETFRELASSVDRFVAFDGSFATQTDMADFLACWVLSTYATCEFDVVGYIWPNAERGSGKTQCLNTITELAYLGLTTTSSSSFASIRDEAMLGATIGFDDCENIKKMDHNKRELLLAGNTKGASVALKVQGRREGDWETQYVDPFAPRAFTSIGLPDPVLESRTIMIPLVQSSDQARTRRKPKNHDDWTIRPSKLRDYAWLNVVCGLADIASAKREMGSEVDLTGRNFDIFQPILTMAYWLQNRHGV
jgi:hypothetical protein